MKNHESEDYHGYNSNEWDNQSNQSRFSQDDNIDRNTQSEMLNDVSEPGSGCNSDQTTLNMMNIPVISDGTITMCLFQSILAFKIYDHSYLHLDHVRRGEYSRGFKPHHG